MSRGVSVGPAVPGLGLVALGVLVIGYATLVDPWTGIGSVGFGTLLIASGAVFIGLARRWQRSGRMIASGVVVAVIGIVLAVWGFTGSFEHDEYPAFGGFAVIGFGALLMGAGIGRAAGPHGDPAEGLTT